jgi:hypothetical protein
MRGLFRFRFSSNRSLTLEVPFESAFLHAQSFPQNCFDCGYTVVLIATRRSRSVQFLDAEQLSAAVALPIGA